MITELSMETMSITNLWRSTVFSLATCPSNADVFAVATINTEWIVNRIADTASTCVWYGYACVCMCVRMTPKGTCQVILHFCTMKMFFFFFWSRIRTCHVLVVHEIEWTPKTQLVAAETHPRCLILICQMQTTSTAKDLLMHGNSPLLSKIWSLKLGLSGCVDTMSLHLQRVALNVTGCI